MARIGIAKSHQAQKLLRFHRHPRRRASYGILDPWNALMQRCGVKKGQWIATGRTPIRKTAVPLDCCKPIAGTILPRLVPGRAEHQLPFDCRCSRKSPSEIDFNGGYCSQRNMIKTHIWRESIIAEADKSMPVRRVQVAI